MKVNKNFKIIIAVMLITSATIAGWLWNASRTAPGAEAAWFNDSWLYRVRLSVDSSKIDADLADFPVAVHLNSDRIDYSNTQNVGQDIRFTDRAGNILDYEIEEWNESATSTVWVRLPGIDDTADTELYLYYGNSSVADEQNATGVWDSNFKLVQHLEESDIDGGADDITDSSSNANHGTTSGMDTSDDVDARVDGGFDFDGSDDYVTVAHDASLNVSGNNQYTMSIWIKPSATQSQRKYIFDKQGEGGEVNTGYYMTIDNTEISCPAPSGNAWNEVKTSGAGMSAGTWAHIYCVYDSSTVKIYINGTLVKSSTLNITLSDSTDPLEIGRFNSAEFYFSGVLDDLRISNIERSAAWAKAEYNTGQDSLLTYNAVETGRGPVGYWSFDEGFGATAYNSGTATSTDGTINGAAWKSEDFCVSGKCLEFDGVNDSVTFPGEITGVQTVTFWVKPTSTNAWFVDLDGSNYISASVGVISATGFTTPSIYVNGVVSTALKQNEWQHIAVTTATAETATALVFGEIGGNYLGGFVDEVKVYPRALSADEIKAEFNARGTAQGLSFRQGQSLEWMSDGLVGYWPMDESAANTCSGGTNDSCDKSGLGNDGAWNGNATATTTAKYGRGVEFDGSGDYVEVSDFDL